MAAGTRVCHQRRHSRFPGDTGTDHPSVPAKWQIDQCTTMNRGCLGDSGTSWCSGKPYCWLTFRLAVMHHAWNRSAESIHIEASFYHTSVCVCVCACACVWVFVWFRMHAGMPMLPTSHFEKKAMSSGTWGTLVCGTLWDCVTNGAS